MCQEANFLPMVQISVYDMAAENASPEFRVKAVFLQKILTQAERQEYLGLKEWYRVWAVPVIGYPKVKYSVQF